MAQILHGRARTTEAVHRVIQDGQESIAQLAECYALKPKTVAKCRKSNHVCDAPMGPKNPHYRIEH